MNKIYKFLLFTTIGLNLNSQTISKEMLECIPPTSFYATELTFTSTVVIWSPSTSAIEYTVNYRELGDTVWYGVSVFEDSSTSIYSLDTCTGYEFFISIVCEGLNTASTEKDTFYTLCDTGVVMLNDHLFTGEPVFYPNPAHGYLNIQFDEPVYGNVSIYIRNTAGFLLKKEEFYLSGENEISQFMLAEGNKGLQFITIVYNNTIITRQIYSSDI